MSRLLFVPLASSLFSLLFELWQADALSICLSMEGQSNLLPQFSTLYVVVSKQLHYNGSKRNIYVHTDLHALLNSAIRYWYLTSLLSH